MRNRGHWASKSVHERHVDATHSVQIGIRGQDVWMDPGKTSRELGYRIVTKDEFDDEGERYQYYVHGLEQSRVMETAGWIVDTLFPGHLMAAKVLQKDIEARHGPSPLAGIRTPEPISKLQEIMPEVYDQLYKQTQRLDPLRCLRDKLLSDLAGAGGLPGGVECFGNNRPVLRMHKRAECVDIAAECTLFRSSQSGQIVGPSDAAGTYVPVPHADVPGCHCEPQPLFAVP